MTIEISDRIIAQNMCISQGVQKNVLVMLCINEDLSPVVIC